MADDGDGERRRIRVRGREGDEVEWSRKAARRAGRLDNWLNDLEPPEEAVFSITETSSTVLRKLAELCDDDEGSSADCLDGCSLAELASLVEGAGNLIADFALGEIQCEIAERLHGKRALELRELLGAVDDFESDEERVQALAEPAFTPDSPTVPQCTAAGPPALPVNDDAAEAALAEVGVSTLIELKGVNRAWRALGRRALCSRLCRREGHADPRQLDEITELNLQLLIDAGRPWEAARAGRLLLHLERLTGYGFSVDVAKVREVDLEDEGDDGEVEEGDLLRGPAKQALCSVMSVSWVFFSEPPLALQLGAIACAGSGAIRSIPVAQMRADGATELNLSNRGLCVAAAMLVAYLIPATTKLKSCNLLRNCFDVESATMLAKIGAEQGIMLSGMKRDSTKVCLRRENADDLQPADAILIASDLQFMAALTELNLDWNEIGVDGAKAIAAALEVNAVLTTLCLNGNMIGDEGAVAIAAALKLGTALTSLELGGNNVGAEGAIAIAEALKATSVLTKLSLGGNQLGVEGVEAIAGVLESGTILTSLELGGNNIGDEGALKIAEALKVNNVLTVLNLGETEIGVEGAKAIAEALKSGTALLSKLELDDNYVGDDGAQAIAEALKVSAVLTTLCLNSNNIGDIGAKAIAVALKVAAALTTLYLDSNHIGDEGADAIAKALESGTVALTTLRLYSNHIGDEGAAAIAVALESGKVALNTLGLCDNRIGPAGGKAIAKALQSGTTVLTKLFLRGNKIGEEGAMAFARALSSGQTVLTKLELDHWSRGTWSWGEEVIAALREAGKAHSVCIWGIWGDWNERSSTSNERFHGAPPERPGKRSLGA